MNLINSSIYSHISENDRLAWCEVTELLNNTTTFLGGNPKYADAGHFRCHSLCDAIAFNVDKYKLGVIDGFYLGLKSNSPNEKDFTIEYCEHSWLVTPDLTIIDPYPVGTLNINPLLIPAKGTFNRFGYNFYVPDHTVSKTVRNRDLFKESKRWKRILRRAKESALANEARK